MRHIKTAREWWSIVQRVPDVVWMSKAEWHDLGVLLAFSNYPNLLFGRLIILVDEFDTADYMRQWRYAWIDDG